MMYCPKAPMNELIDIFFWTGNTLISMINNVLLDHDIHYKMYKNNIRSNDDL